MNPRSTPPGIAPPASSQPAGRCSCPRRGARARGRGAVVLRIGTVQDLDSLNPYQTLLVVGYEAFQLTYNLMVDFGPDLEPVPGFADSWERAADGKSWTFHIREGMKWSDGTPATAQDACFSWQLAVDAIADGGEHRRRLPRPQPQGRRRHQGRVPGRQDADRDDQRRHPSGSSRSTCRSSRSTSGGRRTGSPIADAKFDAPLVGTGPYTVAEWQTGQFVRFVRNASYWGTQGYADEIVIQFFKSEDSMVQALKANEIDYARDPNADQLKALEPDAGITTVVGSANGWTQLAFNTYGTGTARRSRAAVPRRRRSSTRPSATPSATPSTSRSSSTASSAGSATSGHDRPAGPGQLPRRADDPAELQHRAGEVEARRRRLQARRERPAARQGREADQPPAGDAGHERQLPEGRPVRPRLVRPPRRQGEHPGARPGDPRRTRPPAGSRR